jgi:MSHA pilin protein MshD
MSSRRNELGLSLIEMVVFIIVLAIGFTGLVVLYNQTTKTSVDPVVRKQVLAIATSLLEEIELRGFTYCDPDDANVYSASSAAGCASIAESPTLGPDAGETTRSKFDNVNDYHGFQMLSGITDITGATVPNLSGYQVTGVTVVPAGTSFSLADNQDALSIAVTVTGPAGVSVTLQGYRFRYAPNSP